MTDFTNQIISILTHDNILNHNKNNALDSALFLLAPPWCENIFICISSA